MKKLISFLTALSIVTPCVVNAAVAYGDVDSNSTVDSSDASLVLQDYASVSTGGQTTLDSNADVNQDESVDSADASLILAYYAYRSTHDYDKDIKTFITEDLDKLLEEQKPALPTHIDDDTDILYYNGKPVYFKGTKEYVLCNYKTITFPLNHIHLNKGYQKFPFYDYTIFIQTPNDDIDYASAVLQWEILEYKNYCEVQFFVVGSFSSIEIISANDGIYKEFR